MKLIAMQTMKTANRRDPGEPMATARVPAPGPRKAAPRGLNPPAHHEVLPMRGAEVAGERWPMRSMELAGDKVPARVLLAPWGNVESTNGDFVVDEEAARLTVNAFAEHATDLPIDYEHQTLGGEFASPNGLAPAAGWMKRMYAEPGVGLLAEIEWTNQAAEQLASKQYRYLSPVAVVRKSDRKLIAIHSAALTNKPAIVGMPPIVNKENSSSGATVVDDVDERPFEALRRELKLDESAGAEEMLVAAGARLRELEVEADRRRVEERIACAVREGKLVEAQRAWAEELVRRESELFDEWLRTAPVIVPRGVTKSPSLSDVQSNRNRAAARARAEYRANRVLSALTSEEAYVAEQVRGSAGPV